MPASLPPLPPVIFFSWDSPDHRMVCMCSLLTQQKCPLFSFYPPRPIFCHFTNLSYCIEMPELNPEEQGQCGWGEEVKGVPPVWQWWAANLAHNISWNCLNISSLKAFFRLSKIWAGASWGFWHIRKGVCDGGQRGWVNLNQWFFHLQPS